MLSHSLRALCLAPGGSGSIWKYSEALVTLPRESRRIACGFRTDLHFADVVVLSWPLFNHVLESDILEEWEEGQQRSLQDSKALI